MTQLLEVFSQNNRRHKRLQCECGEIFVRRFNQTSKMDFCPSCANRKQAEKVGKRFEGKSMREWADIVGVSVVTLRSRYNKFGNVVFNKDWVVEGSTIVRKQAEKPEIEQQYQELKKHLVKFGNTACHSENAELIQLFRNDGCEIRESYNFTGAFTSNKNDYVTIWVAK
ncbi:MAG: hypothetical protein ACRC1D_06040 [Culicoidibacterales bacterium]